jgi:hypothetical protein
MNLDLLYCSPSQIPAQKTGQGLIIRTISTLPTFPLLAQVIAQDPPNLLFVTISQGPLLIKLNEIFVVSCQLEERAL